MTVPVPLLFLIGDTGGGHRSAANAVRQALARDFPGQFAPVICDPVAGQACPRLQRWIVGLYGPCIRVAPWLWGFLWRRVDSPAGLRFWYGTLFAAVERVATGAVTARPPALIAAFHPMTIRPALALRDRHAPGVPVVTVVTDLVTAHQSWRDAGPDLVVVPTRQMAERYRGPGRGRWTEIGLPVGAEFTAGPLPAGQREALRRSLGLAGDRFLVLLTGGAEGSGGMYRRAAALLRRTDGVDVIAVCGRNHLLRRRLARLAGRSGGRLTVLGFTGSMADWLRCADVVVTKAGPSTIAEAACCGTPLILTSFVPGQEEGNAEFVVAAGAGRRAGSVRALVAEVSGLRRDPDALAAMASAAAALGRPAAAAGVAALLASLAAGTGSAAGSVAGAARQPAAAPLV